MRLVCLADIHGNTLALAKAGGIAREVKADAILICGDIVSNTIYNDFISLLKDTSLHGKCPIILTPGNHDSWTVKKRFPLHCVSENQSEYWKMDKTRYDIVCLLESAYVLNGVKIWGSPYTSRYLDWHWQRDVKDMKFDIPKNTDVLITHEPPFGYGDATLDCRRIGSEALTQAVKDTPNLKLHVFGHNHHDAGWTGRINGMVLANVSCHDENMCFFPRGIKVFEF